MVFTDRGGVYKRGGGVQSIERVKPSSSIGGPSTISSLKADMPSTAPSRGIDNPSLKPSQLTSPMVQKMSEIKIVQNDVWVKKWVDYSSKYGLGYLLSNQSTGVFFNDSTKILIAPDGHTFNYYERKATGSGGGSNEK